MAASVAVTEVPATQPSNPAMHDGKNKLNSPPPTGDLIKIVDDGDADVTSKKCPSSSGAALDDLSSSGGTPVHHGKSASSREDVGKDESAKQESLPNGDYAHHQTGSATSENISCNCPDGPRSRPIPPTKHPWLSPRKPQSKVPPPKLPPKPPHLLAYRSPSSDNLLGRANVDRERDTQVTGRDRRSQSVSVITVHHSPQKEDLPEVRPFKRPIPAPRKSVPNIFADLSPPALDMKNLGQTSPDRDAQTPVSEPVSPVSGASDSKSPSHQGAEPVGPYSQSGHLHSSPVHRHHDSLSQNANRSETVTKIPRKSSTTTRHVRVRERAAIFEKLIEVETTRNRDSQISEPRSRTSSRASDLSDATVPKDPDSSSNIWGSGDRHHYCVNVQVHDNVVLPGDLLHKKDAFAEDETVSVVSMSSDEVFPSPQSSIKSRPRCPPSPNLSEDEDTESTISNRDSCYTDEVLPDSGASQNSKISPRVSGHTDIIVPDSRTRDSDYTDVVVSGPSTIQDIHKSRILHSSESDGTNNVPKSSTQESDYTDVVVSESSTVTLPDAKKSKILYVESDYTDVVVPDSSMSQDSVSPKVTLDVVEPAPRQPEQRLSISVNKDRASDSSAPVKHSVLSPDHAPILPKPFHIAHSYRNVTPLFCVPPRQPQPCKKGDLGTHSHRESADNGTAYKQFTDDIMHTEASVDQEGFEIKLTDNEGRQSDVTVSSETHSEIDQQQTDQVPVAEDTPSEISKMSPEPRRRDQRSKSHPATASMTLYEVWLPDSIDPISLAKRNGAVDAAKGSPTTSGARENVDALEGSEVIEGSEVNEDQHTYMNEGRILEELQNTDPNRDGDGSDMLCNRSRRQHFAVKKRDSNAFNGGRRKWQHESAPATLGGLERQEAATEPPQDVSSPSDRLSQVSSAGSTISSLISNVSIDDADQLSSDDEDYVDVQALSSNASDCDGIPPLPPNTDHSIPQLPPKTDADNVRQLPPTIEPSEGQNQETDSRPLPLEDDTYSTLYECRNHRPERPERIHEDDILPQGHEEDIDEHGHEEDIDEHGHEEDIDEHGHEEDIDEHGHEEDIDEHGHEEDIDEHGHEEDIDEHGHEEDIDEHGHEEEQDHVPVEIEMQPMRMKSPHSPEKESRRKAFEFHMPLFLKNSSSLESEPQRDDRSRHSQTTHSEDSDASSDYIDEAVSIPGVVDSKHKNASITDSSASCEQSEDSWSVGSSHMMSTDSLNLSLQSELRDHHRRRQRSGDRGRPVSEYDRPVSSASTDYDRPVSCISTDYDRPISSTSADYISVLNSFHKNGKKDEDGKKAEDGEGFSYTWTVDHSTDDSHQDETYRPKSDEVGATPIKYASPRKAAESTQPVAVLPVPHKALKLPKLPRPYSEPNIRRLKKNSLVQCKNLPVPSKEEITEQFCKISRQRSRFVSQEPLFQLYQEDARSRDSYLRLMNVSSLESLATFLEKQEALKKEKRESEPIPISSQLPEYRVLIPDEEIYHFQTGEESKSGDNKKRHPSGDNKNISRLGDGLGEAIYQSAEPVYEPAGELYYDTGDILHPNTIYESGSLGSSTGEGSGGSGSDVEIPKPYGLMLRATGASAVRRSYWSELPEVVSSGLLEQMTSEEKRLQEALFEVVTSEASYLRSLNLVVEHFSEAITLKPPTGLLNKVQHHRLFSNIKSVRDASERLLLDLEERQQDSVIISDVCDILLQHFEKGGFNSYIVYCANNQYQIKTQEELRKSQSFLEVMKLLESSPACCSLDLQSFLMLPFQRITRLPLLIEAIRQQAKMDSPLHTTAMQAVRALRNMAEKCNEEAKRMEMIEEVTQLANQLDFREGVKKMNLSQTTSIVKRGRLQIIKKDNKILNRGKLIAKAIYVIVFTDKVAVCKQRMKGEQLKYDVFDWCPRNLVQVESVANPQQHGKLPDGVPSTCKHVFIISFLQNNQKKEVEFAMDTNSEAEKERWMDAMHPAKRTEDGETIYESWDCPQVMCKEPYEAQDRDELTLDLYDRVDIDKKIEGWYYGTRVSDHAKGWFPARFTQEIVNDHVLARNLKQRHRLLSLCDQHLRTAKNVKK